MRTSAPRLQRLTKRAQFQAAAGNGRRFRSSHMTVQVLDRGEDGLGVRIGLTASRKTGLATKRNRIRRRLRAAAREAFAAAPEIADAVNADVVAVARTEVLSASYDDLVRTLRHALTKARPQRKQQANQSGSGNGQVLSTPREQQETQRS